MATPPSDASSATTATKRELETSAPTPAVPEVAVAADSVSAEVQNSGEEPASGESAAKKQRVKIDKEDTSSYMGTQRSKVRGNIRGADKYKGKRKDPWGPGSRNAEDAAKAAAATSESTNDADANADNDGEKEAKIPKRKVALLMGYCGTGYQGMQV